MPHRLTVDESDIGDCRRYDRTVRVIACIEGQDVIDRILTHLRDKKMYTQVDCFDAAVNTVDVCEHTDFVELTEEMWMATVLSKMMGQIHLVRVSQEYIDDGSSFSPTSGILSSMLIAMAIVDATTCSAIDTFVKGVAYEMPRGIRINAIIPTVINEAWGVYGEMMSGFQSVPGALAGKPFAISVEGFITGKVIIVDA